MTEYKNIAEFENATVAVSYKPIEKSGSAYQSEDQMEKRLIEQLCTQGYDYLPIHTEKELVGNLRRQIEVLSDYRKSLIHEHVTGERRVAQ